MKHSIIIKNKASQLRRQGYSLKELSKSLHISKSTASLWVRNLQIDSIAQKRLTLLSKQARDRAEFRWKQYRKSRDTEIEVIAKKSMLKWRTTQENSQILASLLFWAEGSKDLGNISFMNSDPVMVKTFLGLLRKSFVLDETKFRVLLHLHEYHDEVEMKDYWSKITQIPIDQFSKTYIKAHTRTRIHPDYKGCCKIKYYDSHIARVLAAIYNSLAKLIGP
jgi:hypothetical protein